MKKKGNKLFPILGIVGFALYILLYLIILIYNFSVGNYFVDNIPDMIFRFLSTLVLDGVIVVFLIVSMTKYRTTTITNILSLIAIVLLLILNVKDLVSQIMFMSKIAEHMFSYPAYLIQEISYLMQDITALLFHVWVGLSILGLTIKKHFPYKVFTILAFVAIGFIALSMMGMHIGSIMIYLNIRVVFSEILYFLRNIDLLLFLIALTITIYKNSKEI